MMLVTLDRSEVIEYAGMEIEIMNVLEFLIDTKGHL